MIQVMPVTEWKYGYLFAWVSFAVSPEWHVITFSGPSAGGRSYCAMKL